MAARNNSVKSTEENVSSCDLHLFSGEIVIARANVVRYNSMSSRSCGTAGTLYFTNFKVCFASTNVKNTEVQRPTNVASLENLLSQENGSEEDLMPLAVISQVFVVSKQKRKQIKQQRTKDIPDHYDIIEIETKDFRIIQYDFRFSKLLERRSCFRAISHHMFPVSVTNLFGFDYAKHISKEHNDNAQAFWSFRNRKDYEMNLCRLRAAESWRVSDVNSSFKLCNSLPEHVVVPAELSDHALTDIASKYAENRLPVWLWSDPATGVSLLMSSDLKEKNGSFTHPITLLDSITNCQSKGSGFTTAVDVAENFPNVKELNNCFTKLKKTCVVHSVKEYWTSDLTWLSDLEKSSWLKLISNCLSKSMKVITVMRERATSVVVHDSDGRNLAMVISSIVQILLDPYYRTHLGLKVLLQKDWVMKGYQFRTRLGTIYQNRPKDKEESYNGESPLFLLFLDCVHQLLRQFPLKFEFNEQFLIFLIDCSYSAMFETFLFDSDFECQQTIGNSRLITVWDFITEHVSQFKFTSVLTNPSHKLDESESIHFDDHQDKESLMSDNSSSTSLNSNDVLNPSINIVDLFFWHGLFNRWYPCTNPHKGCSAEVILQMQQHQLAEEIQYLQNRLMQLQQASNQHLDEYLRHIRSPSNLSNGSSSSINRKKTKHKRNPSKLSCSEKENDDFLTLMTGFYFLKLV